MRRLLPTALVLACLAGIPLPAQAWGPMGHRLVARLAEERLSPQARAEVLRLLADEYDPSMAGVANWADNLRTSDPVLGRRSARWHYVNIGESDCQYLPERDCPKGDCVVQALHEQTRILADRDRGIDERRQALKFVIHMVGDAHQPLHAGYSHDLGGNRHQVRLGQSGTNLHSVWDSGMLNSQRLDEDGWMERLRGLEVEAGELPLHAGNGPGEPWAEQSCKLVTGPGFYPPTSRIDNAYIQAQLPQLQVQLKLAGVRLAQLLDAVLAPSTPATQ